jgi:TonB family protein
MKTKLLILALFVTLKISGQTVPQYGLYTERGKDGLVKFYNRGVLTSEGKYNDREKVGVWTGYTRGFERLKYDFSTNQLILYVPATIDSVQRYTALIPSADTIFERMPIFINGFQTLKNNLSREMLYPAIARENKLQGEVLLSFTIDEKGNMLNPAVKKSLGMGTDEEALRVLKRNLGEWVPAQIHGKPVAVECELPVVFQIVPPNNRQYAPNAIVITTYSVIVIR